MRSPLFKVIVTNDFTNSISINHLNKVNVGEDECRRKSEWTGYEV